MSTEQGYCTIMNPSHMEGCIHCSRQHSSHLETVRIRGVIVMTAKVISEVQVSSIQDLASGPTWAA